MQNSNVFRVFPNEKVPPFVKHAEGLYIYTQDGRKILDASGGGTEVVESEVEVVEKWRKCEEVCVWGNGGRTLANTLQPMVLSGWW